MGVWMPIDRALWPLPCSTSCEKKKKEERKMERRMEAVRFLQAERADCAGSTRHDAVWTAALWRRGDRDAVDVEASGRTGCLGRSGCDTGSAVRSMTPEEIVSMLLEDAVDEHEAEEVAAIVSGPVAGSWNDAVVQSLAACGGTGAHDVDVGLLMDTSSAGNREHVADGRATCDWIDALEVDNMPLLLSELELAQRIPPATTTTHAAASAASNVDARVFVPAFRVQIEGGYQSRRHRPVVGPDSTDLLVGPPGVMSSLLVGKERVGRSKCKRPLVATQVVDPLVSHARRASAAKRQRVKGRFVRDAHTFVSITALQR
ncbi:unnamed protein product [Hyaloperonospora brassicae]|uniref:CCT domain-containing protein n=1 Tax=Hyaloperonospora brassicae TaxID=162125 RepID=A0AAV0TWP4_HYABA|nr:unnamed protein product [Hyaloperonospora brassicae]